MSLKYVPIRIKNMFHSVQPFLFYFGTRTFSSFERLNAFFWCENV